MNAITRTETAAFVFVPARPDVQPRDLSDRWRRFYDRQPHPQRAPGRVLRAVVG